MGITKFLDAMKKFCNNHEHIICYGAGRYARSLTYYLQENGIKIDACVITGDVAPGSMFMKDIPLYSIKTFPTNDTKQGIILGLQSMYHKEVRKTLAKTVFSSYDIFEVDDEYYDVIRSGLQNMRRDKELNRLVSLDACRQVIYDEEINCILKKYDKINLQYIDLRNIGCVVAWIYYLNQYVSSKREYRLFYPFVDSSPEKELISANAYLSTKFKADGIEVISIDNIEFWRYFLKKCPKLFIINNEFKLFDFLDKLNRFALTYRQSTDLSYIQFTDEERRNGMLQSERMNVKENFVCFNARDSVYRKKISNLNTDFTNVVARYRDSNIENFKLAMESLANSSLQAVRMGALSDNRLVWHNTIDYSHDYRSEFMDVYLFSKCQFFVSNPSGIQAIPQLFSKPLVSVNSAVLTTRHSTLLFSSRDVDLVIFKKMWWEKGKKYLTFREMLEREVDDSIHDMITAGTFLSYKRDGIIPIENTPEEINDVVQEMVARLNGTMVYTEEDERLQQKYFDLIDSYPMKNNFPFMWRVGAKFLRENAWLLD